MNVRAPEPRTGAGLAMRPITIGDAQFPYHFGNECMDEIVDHLAAMDADHFFVVTDDTVLDLHGSTLLRPLRAVAPVSVLTNPAGESMKCTSVLGRNLERMIDAGATRRSVVVAFGGGAPGNLAGLLAALVFRGIRLVHVPTTTTAAMDSVLSLKQAINSARGKNHFGTYLAPSAVYTDVSLLATLPEREMMSGLCEATKNCLAIEPDGLAELREVLLAGGIRSPERLLWLLDISARAKTLVTASDTREQRAGLVLEYGHTVGHAVEISDPRPAADRLSHGHAIAFGMVVAAHLAGNRGWLDDDDIAVHEEIVGALGAPTRLPGRIGIDVVLDVVRRDNKRGYIAHGPDEVPFVLLRGFGRPAGAPTMPLVPVALREVREVLQRLSSTDAASPVADRVAR